MAFGAALFVGAALAQGQVRRVTVTAPRVALVPEPSLRLVPGATRELSQALSDHGARLVPLPARRPPQTPAALARSVGADAVIQVGVDRRRRPPRYRAVLRVTDARGQVRLRSTVRLASRRLTWREAGALASLAVRSLEPPGGWVRKKPVLPPAPVGPPSVAGPTPPVPRPKETSVPRALAPAPSTPPVPVPVVPAPRKLALASLFAGPTLTWRAQGLSTGVPGVHAGLGSASPFVGLAVGGSFFPFNEGGRSLGFSLSYSYSPLRLTFPKLNGSERASEHQFTADVLAHFRQALFGGDIVLHLGFAYDGLLTPAHSPLVTTVHFGPRLGVGYSHGLPFGLRAFADLSLRPFTYVGSDLRAAYGANASSTGIDASVGLSGPLPVGVPGLRWTAGYGYLRYEDELRQGRALTSQTTSVHRVTLGVDYERRF